MHMSVQMYAFIYVCVYVRMYECMYVRTFFKCVCSTTLLQQQLWQPIWITVAKKILTEKAITAAGEVVEVRYNMRFSSPA